jgi:alkylglycerol monooxygenase
MNINPIVLSIPIYFILIGVELLVERFSNHKSYRLPDAITNISCGITDQVAHAFLKIIALAGYQFVFEKFALMQIPHNWWTYILLFIGADFCYYWAHRMSHEINLFWAGHVVHHQSEDYNLSVALRQGSFQILFTSLFNLPLAFLGFDTLYFLSASAFVTLYQFWIHTEHIKKLPHWFESIFNTPSHHRVHHGRNPKYIDRNHAGVFIIWDKIFGTFQAEEETPTYGITVPVNSWNPVYAHFTPFVQLFQATKMAKGIIDKLRVVFNPPGWLPEYAGGFQHPKPVEKSTYKKFTTSYHTWISVYVLVHFVSILVAASFFLFNENKLELSQKLIAGALIIWSVANFGILFENKKGGYYMEIARLIIAPITLFNLFFKEMQLDYISYIIYSFFIFSVLWLIVINNNLHKKHVEN